MKIRQELIDNNDIYPYVLGFDCDGREIEEPYQRRGRYPC